MLDEGAVVSLGDPPPLPSSCASSRGNTVRRTCDGNSCCNGLASRSQLAADDTLAGDFVVGISSEEPAAAISGFPLPMQAESFGEGHTGTAAAGVAYAVLACQEDVDHAVAGAQVGPGVFAPDVCGGVARQEREGGLACGALGGVEEQVGWRFGKR